MGKGCIFVSSKTLRAGGAYCVSQNFLTSARVIDGLLRLTTITRADHVWEIGAGKDHITRQLLKTAGRVTAVEIDPALYRRLAGQMAAEKDLHLIHGDFLRTPLPQSKPYKVFANIPFHLTSAIVKKLTTAPCPPTEAWLIMERGAAMRFAGRPGETLSSVLVKPYFHVRIAKHLRRENFHPMPSVDIAVLHLKRKDAPDLSPERRTAFEAFVRGTLKGLRGGGRCPLTKRQMAVALREAGRGDIPQSATMDYVQWLCLFRCWERFEKAGHFG